ncbi:MAG: hypothetical protein C0P77_003995 [Thermoanaerobacterales bacterium]|jgi:hypothetical protein|nr:hypothetical protein [Thermoanaerobacterales bacterium]
MLWFEREVVGALTTTTDQSIRSSVEAFVDGALRDWPEHLRLGVAAESVLLGTWAAVLRALGRLPAGDPAALRELLDRWEHGPIGLVRSYVRAMKSLVIMAEHDMLAEEAA